MPTEFKLQDPGEGIHEAEIREVLVSPGDEVEEGQNVLVVETDKAAVDISSPYTGTVKAVNVAVGDTAEVGDVLMTFETGEGVEEAPAETREVSASRDEKKATRESEGRQQQRQADKEEAAKEQKKDRRRAGNGADSRERKRVLATPATRRVAKELGVDLERVEGSGEDGRITKEDVRAQAGERGDRKKRAGKRGTGASDLPDFEQWGPVERRPLRSVRRTIAQRMATSWERIPHVTHHDKVDISDLESFRRRHADDPGMDGKLTMTAIVVKALAAALREHPRFNASLDEQAEEIILKKHYHLGVAVDTEQGLMVPVVRDVDRKSLAEVASEVGAIAERTRNGKASRQDLSGGTFTLTNVGGLGGTAFSPLINYPEVGIFGLARARLEPVVRGDMEDYEIVPRLMLPVCLAFDHRVNDGADAARFVNRLKEMLSDSERFALAT